MVKYLLTQSQGPVIHQTQPLGPQQQKLNVPQHDAMTH